MNNNTVRRFRNSSFFKNCVPDSIQGFITKNDFYSNLAVIMIEANSEEFEITTIQRKIVYRRFIKGKTIQEITQDLNITNSEYAQELENLERNIHAYMENYVAPYPIRVVILKIRSLSHKRTLRDIYKGIPESKITTNKFIQIVSDDVKGKYATGYIKLLSLCKNENVRKCVDKDRVYINNVYMLLVPLTRNEVFLKYVNSKEKTKHTTIINAIQRLDDWMEKNDAELKL